jgi:hypothetical protein
MRAVLLCLLASFASTAAGAVTQESTPLVIGAQALRHGDAAGMEGCGVRLNGGRVNVKRASYWFDVSVNVYAAGHALVQAIQYSIDPPAFDVRTPPERTMLQSAWIRVDRRVANTRMGENRERRDAVIYAIDLEEARALFEGLAHGQAIAIGIKRWGDPEAAVYVGTPELNGDTLSDLGSCLDALVPQ